MAEVRKGGTIGSTHDDLMSSLSAQGQTMCSRHEPQDTDSLKIFGFLNTDVLFGKTFTLLVTIWWLQLPSCFILKTRIRRFNQ